MLKLTATDYRTLYDIVFRDDYPGYRPNVIESPNGDGVKDAEKRYAHVAQKYVRDDSTLKVSTPDGWIREDIVLAGYLNRCHEAALDVAVQLGIPRQFWPDIRYSALRVLEYPPGAGSAKHTDFDLFTLNLYRNVHDPLITIPSPFDEDPPEGIHYGELLSEVWNVSQHKDEISTKHSVEACLFQHQYSLVYFALPDEAAVLPSGQTVGEWVEERKSRSRYDV